MKRKIPIGISDFGKIIRENYFYVDKSLLIKEIITDGSEVVLFPRPRRFGKTLNMSMLQYFFEKTDAAPQGLFEGLQIWREEVCREYCGRYPVIYLSFKDLKTGNWSDSLYKINELITREYLRHDYLLTDQALKAPQKQYFETILLQKNGPSELENSLKNLSEYLYQYHHQKVIILIDEYDTPIESSYVNGYFESLINFMRNFLSGGLKDNIYLEKGILTGILRVAKENIFSGLNNFKVSSLLERRYSPYFGFTEPEVEQGLEEYGLTGRKTEIKDWYNGYLFGNTVIYNPWSVINALDNPEGILKPYWVNTSSNNLIRRLVTQSGVDVKEKLEELWTGGSLEKPVYEDIIYQDVEKNREALWSFLLFNGYLKSSGQKVIHDELHVTLELPNREVRVLYRQIIEGWFNESISNDRFNLLLKSLTTGDIETFEEIFADFVEKSFSVFDSGEKLYHGFVLGLLIALSHQYEVKSNKDSGYGRYDVSLIPRTTGSGRKGIIFEFKTASKRRNETLEVAVDLALQQIAAKNYRAELQERGIREIIEIGIAFSGKEIALKWREII